MRVRRQATPPSVPDSTSGAALACAILVPVLARPARVAPLLLSIRNATPEPHRVLFICDPDDAPEIAAVDAAGAERVLIKAGYPGKINLGVHLTTEPLLFLGADDLVFHAGWLERATARLAPRIGVVGTNDIANPRVMSGEHATHCLVTRSYVEQFGTIDQRGQLLHEGYGHQFCDDELVGTARHRNAFVFAADAVVEHLHPCWGTAPTDSTYEKGQATFMADRRLYRRRRPQWRT